jgi:hypothetical protein
MPVSQRRSTFGHLVGNYIDFEGAVATDPTFFLF